jgi:hypothetical protein
VRTLVVVISLSLLACAAACPAKPDTPKAEPGLVLGGPVPGGPVRGGAPPFVKQPAGKRVAIVYTASVQGYVEPCGCTAEPLGGVARLAALIDMARAAYGEERVLFLDAGDLLFERADDTAAADACQAEARADLLVETYARKGLVATVLGPLDDVRGASFRDARMAKNAVTTVGVNPPRDAVDRAIHATGVLRSAGAAKIGVSAFRVDKPDDVAAAKAGLTSEVARLRGDGADAIVVLAQSPRSVIRSVVEGIAGVDVVILGRAPGEVPAPPETLPSGAVIVASGMQAQHAGVLELVLDGRVAGKALALDDRAAEAERRAKVLALRVKELDKQIIETGDAARKEFLAQRRASAQAELDGSKVVDAAPLAEAHVVARALPLPRGFAEEPAAAQGLAAYTKSVPTLVASCEASLTCPEPPAGSATYVGATTCKACHAPAYAFWEKQRVSIPAKDKAGNDITRVSGHAVAWDTLVHDAKDTDRTCVGCHSVGFSEPGGACKTSDIVKKGLQGVQCESCHGAGSLHVSAPRKDNIVRATGEATCRACHKVPHIPTTESFVFGDRVKLITGPGHGS